MKGSRSTHVAVVYAALAGSHASKTFAAQGVRARTADTERAWSAQCLQTRSEGPILNSVS